MSEAQHDVVIIGAGVGGAILAQQLTLAGKNVLLLEAGVATDMDWSGYQQSLETFYGAYAKVPESPYPRNPNAPQPDVLDIGGPIGTGYFIQKGPVPFGSTYDRRAGGTTLHWLGTCLRMLPEDFHLQRLFGVGRDWPMTYDELEPDYALAELAIGVSADVEDQQYLGIKFPPDYVYPMRKIPQSYLDRQLGRAVDDMEVSVGGVPRRLHVRSTPQGRNSIPNPSYRKPKEYRGPVPERGYTPFGAVDPAPEGQQYARDLGQRCAGNTNCTPICPIQAKYSALKSLAQADKARLTIRAKSVASKIHVDPDSGRVTSIEYKRYESTQSGEYTTHQAKGTFYVLAAHAVENAKLMLGSGLAKTSGQVGCNLMDHPSVLTWGLFPEDAGAYRGPLSTSGIEDLRGGAFRSRHAAFRIEVGNDGWSWPTGAPNATLTQAIGPMNLFGEKLRRFIADVVSRQFRLGFLIEQLPNPTNRVTIDPMWVDQIGNYRPVIQYNLDDYSLEAMAVAKRVSDDIYRRAGVHDCTDTSTGINSVAEWNGQSFEWGGAGHFAGTHIMGTSANTSVVDSYQRVWDHDNLYAIGCGSMPNMGTSNPTLTLAATTFRTARQLLQRLG